MNIIKKFRQWDWDDKAFHVGQFFYALLIAIGLEVFRRAFKELTKDNTEQYQEPPIYDSAATQILINNAQLQ